MVAKARDDEDFLRPYLIRGQRMKRKLLTALSSGMVAIAMGAAFFAPFIPVEKEEQIRRLAKQKILSELSKNTGLLSELSKATGEIAKIVAAFGFADKEFNELLCMERELLSEEQELLRMKRELSSEISKTTSEIARIEAAIGHADKAVLRMERMGERTERELSSEQKESLRTKRELLSQEMASMFMSAEVMSEKTSTMGESMKELGDMFVAAKERLALRRKMREHLVLVFLDEEEEEREEEDRRWPPVSTE